MCVSNAKLIHRKQNAVSSRVRTPRSQLAKFYRHETEVTRNCVHHFLKNIQTPTVRTTSRKIHIRRELTLTNKVTIMKNIHLYGA